MVNNIGKYVDEKNAYIKREVDDFTKLLDHVKKTIDERPHIIAVHTHYYGDLIKGKYQFTFGENETHPALAGFLIPHSGRIKKITSRVESFIFITGSLFSFVLTKNKEKEQTRLADYIFELGFDSVDEEEKLRELPCGVRVGNPWRKKIYFDNDLENYPLSEGDLINIRTEKDYNFDDIKTSLNFTFLIELDTL